MTAVRVGRGRPLFFEDPGKRFGYLEQKLAQVSPVLLIATCWTVTLGDAVDEADSYALSRDDGTSWSPPQSTGIWGQTMTPIPLGGGPAPGALQPSLR